jgi:hypothetical protein
MPYLARGPVRATVGSWTGTKYTAKITSLVEVMLQLNLQGAGASSAVGPWISIFWVVFLKELLCGKYLNFWLMRETTDAA